MKKFEFKKEITTVRELIRELSKLPPDAEVALSADLIYRNIKDIEPVEDATGEIIFYALK